MPKLRKLIVPVVGLILVAIGMINEWIDPGNKDGAVLTAACGAALVVLWCFESARRDIVEGRARHKLLREAVTLPYHDDWFK